MRKGLALKRARREVVPVVNKPTPATAGTKPKQNMKTKQTPEQKEVARLTLSDQPVAADLGGAQ